MSIGTGIAFPAVLFLAQNYPNPFNSQTTIQYGLPRPVSVTIKLYNTLGQGVTTMVEETQQAGYHETRLDGTGLASGVYFYRIQAGDFVHTKELLLLR
jgi:hypothetical protein